jgi:hypothetical protein
MTQTEQLILNTEGPEGMLRVAEWLRDVAHPSTYVATGTESAHHAAAVDMVEDLRNYIGADDDYTREDGTHSLIYKSLCNSVWDMVEDLGCDAPITLADGATLIGLTIDDVYIIATIVEG